MWGLFSHYFLVFMKFVGVTTTIFVAYLTVTGKGFIANLLVYLFNLYLKKTEHLDDHLEEKPTDSGDYSI